MARKLARVSILDESTSSYTPAVYVIAQLGKNYSPPHDKRLDGSVLLDFALEAISEMKYSIGGVMEFLECEDNKFLMDLLQSRLSLFSEKNLAPLDNFLHSYDQKRL